MHPGRGDKAEEIFGDPSDDSLIDAMSLFLSEKLDSHSGVSIRGTTIADKGLSATCWIVEADCAQISGGAETRRFVFRLQTAGQAYDNSRAAEFEILRALSGRTTLRVPRALWFSSDPAIFGTPFAVYEWISGTAHYDLFSSNVRTRRERRHLFDQFIDELVHIHSVDWVELGLDRYDTLRGDPQGANTNDPAAAQLAYYLSRLSDLEHLFDCSELTREAIAWLRSNLPTPRRLCLVHGDFGPHNALIHEGSINALVDWEFAQISDPLQDVAYFTIRGRSIRDNFDQDVLTANQFVDLYSRRSGFDIDAAHFRWWQLFGMVRSIIGRAHQARWIQETETPGKTLPIPSTPEDDRILRRLLPITSG